MRIPLIGEVGPNLAPIRYIGRVPLILLILWFTSIWWGERRVYSQSAAACVWDKWEHWPDGAEPHHVLLIADPQLVDPHTYPGRSRLLSSLTVWITDLYIRRTYNAILSHIQPHSTLFLGDLFDGGREWATNEYQSPDNTLKGYDTNFWLKEYQRFMSLFVDGWLKHNLHDIPSPEGRRIITSLPGNHDLGFAGGINEQVKSRFDAHFGPLNRIDILGNHTFVSIDTVSLSAMDEIDPKTGSSGTGDGTAVKSKNSQIWQPVEGFLRNVNALRSRAVTRRYNELQSVSIPNDDKKVAQVPSTLFPTVLLSHVPLFRNGDVSCGPLRERGKAIPLAAGYQYQNVLTPLISSDIVKHLGADQMTMIYSGDDHDYCEIEHGEFTGRIREITVKSTSMAMGISRPGVQLVSLWNPIDLEAVATVAQGIDGFSMPRDTVQNHLCLLPYQGGIFIRYAVLLLLTVITLLVRAISYRAESWASSTSNGLDYNKAAPLLPVTRKRTHPASPTLAAIHSHTSSASSTTARSRASGKAGLSSYGNVATISRSASPVKLDLNINDDWSTDSSKSRARAASQSYRFQRGVLAFGPLRRGTTKSSEFTRSFMLVALPALLFYFWLIWNG